MGCLLKTLEKGFVRLDKDQKNGKKDKINKSNKSKNKSNNKSTKDKNDNNIDENEKEINIIKPHIEKNRSQIKNKDNYFKAEQIDYYTNIYLPHLHFELKEKINFKK